MENPSSESPALAPSAESVAPEAAAALPPASGWRAAARLTWLPAFGRAAVVFSLIGVSLAIWAQTTFQAKWVKDFILANQLEPGKRKLLLASILAGAAIGALVTVVAAVREARRGGSMARVEKAAWLLSPLLALAPLPVIFRHAIWKDRTLDLLVVVMVVLVLVQGTVRRAFESAPSWLSARVERLREGLPPLVRIHAATITVWVAVVAYIVAMSHWSILRHHKLQSAISDLGISDNLIYNALAGKFMESPIFSGPAGGLHFLAGHAQFGQYLFLPFYALYPRAETLLVIQSTALGLCAIPLYAFCRRRLSPWMSALLALAFLAYYPNHGANLYEMTYLPVACPFIFATVWALDAGRYRWLVFFLAAALSMREDISIGLAITGTAFAMAGHHVRAAFLVALVSTVYFVVVRFGVMPAYGLWGFPEGMYGQLLAPGAPKTFGSVIRTLITNPVFTLGKIATQEKLVFVLHMLVPLAFLPIRRSWFWPALLPGTLTTLLTTGYAPTVSLGFHYTLLWSPYLWVTVPLALAVIRDGSLDGKARMRAAFVALLVCSAGLSYNLGAFARPPNFKVGFQTFDFKLEPAHRSRYAELRELVEMLPPDASVCMTEIVGAHAANRVNALSMRAGPQDAEYLLVSQKDFDAKLMVPALDRGEYGVLARRGHFALLKKGHDTSGNAALRKDWKL
ncbi:MAG: DUF2079 domain-containing protein [Polyangiaceae bacterium]|nr:DUF2079 domain-containing protein [Polyangiaceae bacterium]